MVYTFLVVLLTYQYTGLPVRVITLLSAVRGTRRSAGSKNPFFAPKMCHISSVFMKNSGAPMWEALSWVPFEKIWEVTWSGAFQSLEQVPARHLRKWLDWHLIKYYTWLLTAKRVYTSSGSSCPTYVHQSPWQSRENTICWRSSQLWWQKEPKLVYTLFCCKLVNI